MIENIIKDYGLYIIIIETVIIVALLLWHFFFFNKDSKVIDSYERKLSDLNIKLRFKQKTLDDYKNAFDQANKKLQQWNDWYEQNKHLLSRRDLQTNVVEFDLSQEPKQQVNASQVLYQYLQEANDGKFLRILSSPEKCYFRTWEEGGVRKYEFYGNVAKALANINAIFDDVCEMEGKRSGATVIENVSAGTLDSELRITSKARIRLK